MIRVSVIGAGGFIGRHLCEELTRGKSVAVSRYGRKTSVGPDVQPLDFDNNAQLQKIGTESDIVFFLASETIPASSWSNPLIDVEGNLKPFIRFLENATASGLKKCVFISSAGTVYGTTSGKVKEDADKRPFSPYGIIKLAMENYLEYYHRKTGLNYDVFRVSNVYGEGQNTGKGLGIINTFLEKIIRREEIVVYGDGSATRNYVYVKDVAALMSRSLQRMNESGIFNLASNSTASISELVDLLRKIVHEEIRVRYEPGRQSDNSYIDLDNSNILRMAPGFKFTSLQQGLLQTYQALKKETRQSNV